MSVSSSSSSSGLQPPIVDYGLVSGLNTQAIIQAELQPFQQPETNLQNEQSTLNANVGYYQQINSDLMALKTVADQLASPSGWGDRAATSSDSAVATATAAAGTPVGSLQFSVSQLAAADSLVSSGSVSSTSQIVDSAGTLLLSQGGAQYGFASLAGGAGLTIGTHTLDVTQASQAASTTGTLAVGSQSSGITVTTASNDTVDVTVNGTAYQLVIGASPSGGYSGSGLLGAVRSAISAAGASGVLQAGYDPNGHLILSSVAQGSTQSLQVTGGDGLATLGLTAMASALSGVDAIVTLDGKANDLSTVTAGSTVTLNGANGPVSATLDAASAQQQANSPLVSVGSLSATNVSTGTGSLADVVSAVNASGSGILASAVQNSAGQYVLSLSSSQTGTASAVSVDPTAFSGSPLGTLLTATAGADALIRVGGANGYTVSSQNNTFSGLLPGLSVTVAQPSSTPVTVSVAPDAKTEATKVQTLVADANTVLSDIQKYAGYNEQTKQGGPLMGSAVLQDITAQVQAIVASVAGSSTLGNSSAVGIKLDSGQITFDQQTFEQAFAANPTAVENLFTRGGTFAAAAGYQGAVSLSYASDTTKAGTYAVTVSHSATQAVDTGAVLVSGTVSAAEALSITSNGATAAYHSSAGESLSAVAAGLNQAFAAQGMGLSAQVVGNGQQLQLVTDGYGSSAAFTVSTTSTAAGTTGLTGGSASASFAGTDVAGQIGGVSATGVGQYLSAPSSDRALAGLSLQVTASGITAPTAIGSFTYAPGLAQALATLGTATSDPTSGELTQTITNLQQQSSGLSGQIQFYASIVAQQRQLLMAQYATLESTLGTLKNQSSSLAAQLAQLP